MKQPKVQRGEKPINDKQDTSKKPEPFDLWLKRGLHQIYDDVANEPIPEDLLKLIEEDRNK